MARINIENSIYRDMRFIKLVVKLGCVDKALGALVRAWALAQDWYLKPGGRIPLTEWNTQQIRREIIDVGLADVDGPWVAVKGVDEQFAWLRRASNAGMAGGKGRPRNHSGIPIAQANSSKRKLTSSSSSSSRVQVPKESVSCPTVPTRLDEIFEGFPKRSGDRKKFKAIEYLKKLSEDQLTLVEKSVKNYASWMTSNAPSDKRMIPMMVSWLNSRSWEEWIDPVAANPLTTPKKLNLEDL